MLTCGTCGDIRRSTCGALHVTGTIVECVSGFKARKAVPNTAVPFWAALLMMPGTYFLWALAALYINHSVMRSTLQACKYCQQRLYNMYKIVLELKVWSG